MELYIIFALASAFSFSLAIIINKHLLKNIVKNYYLFIFYICVFGLVSSFLIWSLVPMTIPSTSTMLYVVGNALFYFLAMIVANYVVFHGDVSVVGPLTQTKTLFMIFLSFFLLGESFSLSTYLWITLMVIGGAVVSLDENFNIKSFFTFFILIVFLSNFMWAITDIMAKKVMAELDIWNANAWRMLVMSPLALALVPFIRKEKIWIGAKKVAPMLLIFILSDILGVIFILSAFNLGTVTISNAFAMMRGPFIILITLTVSMFKPKLLEHHTKKVYLARFIGSVIMLFAALQLIL